MIFYLRFKVCFWVNVLGHVDNITLKEFLLINIVFKGILMLLSQFYCVLLLTMLCRLFGMAKNHALFVLNIFSLKFGWCKENNIWKF